MKTLLITLIMVSFMLTTALVFVYLSWGIGRLLRLKYMPGYHDTSETLFINRCGEALCAVYAPFVLFLLAAIFI